MAEMIRHRLLLNSFKNVSFSFHFYELYSRQFSIPNRILSVFLGLHLRHMVVPRLGVQSELELPAYTTATATPDLSRVCDPHHSSWQRWILNPLSKARARTRNLMVSSQIRFHCATMGTPANLSFI